MASFNSILGDVGNFFKKAFTSKAAQVITTGVEVFAQSPLAALVMGPAGAALLKNTALAVENAEMAAIAAGQQNGTGAQKAALVLQNIDESYNAFAAANNLPVTPATMQAYLNAFVALANSFPASTTPATVTVPTPQPTGSVFAPTVKPIA